MTPKKILKPDFQKKIQHIERIWNGKEGLSLSRALYTGIDLYDLKFIFIRDDGWSIACDNESYSTCYNLWKDYWTEILTF